MKTSDLRPVGQLAKKVGAKCILYGPPGTGKTPMVCQLKKAVMCCIEQGLSSVRDNMSMPAWNVCGHKNLTPTEAFMQFYKWCISPQSSQFETFIFDSLTELANIFLKDAMSKTNHGKKAYGDMADTVLGIVHSLCELPNKNVIFLAQMASEEIPLDTSGFGGGATRKYNRPLFPGKRLDKEIPHCIDEILYVDRTVYPSDWGQWAGHFGPAIHTIDTGNAMARSRCGKLNPLEPCDLNYVFNKINS